MGEAPDWYGDFVAAERLGVPVPQVRSLPLFWRQAALAVVGAESKASRIRAKRGQ